MKDMKIGLIELEYTEPGYWLGTLMLGDVPYHVEAVLLKRRPALCAQNPMYQVRIDSWLDDNEDCRPKAHVIDGRRYFVPVSVYAE